MIVSTPLELGKTCVNYWPRYKADPPEGLPRKQQRRSCILYHRARKLLQEEFPGAYLMPNALKLPESITENAKEADWAWIRREVYGLLGHHPLIFWNIGE